MSHKLNFDSEFVSFLEETRGISKIVDLILYHRGEFLKKTGDFIRKEAGNETISFIPKSKLGLLHTGFNETKYRTPLKIGRFISKFISSEGLNAFGVDQYDVETFVNLYKSFFDRDESRLKIVEGDDILKYYLFENYYRPNTACIGTLWNSCMRYREKNRYMEIYAKNPDKIKMLVLFGEDGKVKTRALLWESCQDRDGNTHKVMDRIYSIYDHDMIFFKNWALKNGYIHKYEQSARSENIFVTPQNPDPIRIDLTVKLDNHICDYYPYIDSFKFYSRKYGTLSNSEFFSYKYVLVQNDGGLVPPKEEEYDEEEVMEDNW
jgi:hypothetical protein